MWSPDPPEACIHSEYVSFIQKLTKWKGAEKNEVANDYNEFIMKWINKRLR